jgi:hypothetical protein
MPISFVVRRYMWTVSLLVWTAALTAVLVVGPGARLAMRLLAVTAGSAAQGRKTEADEIVGRISADGTIGIFLFVGLFAGFVSVLTYLVVRRWLPSGRLRGLALGVLLLVVMGSRIDPLRADNPDFDLVGPGWLSIVVFSVFALVQGMAVVAVAGRVGRWLPMPSGSVRSLVPHIVLILLIPGFIVLLGAIAVGALAVALSQTPARNVLGARWVSLGGRVALAVGVLVALPGFVAAVADIGSRGP